MREAVFVFFCLLQSSGVCLQDGEVGKGCLFKESQVLFKESQVF